MPELAEVEFYRKKWANTLGDETVTHIDLHSNTRVFRDVIDKLHLLDQIVGKNMSDSRAHGKQMLFGFEDIWLGVHLGMTGRLRREDKNYSQQKADHLVIHTKSAQYVFADSRQFGKILIEKSPSIPTWFVELPPEILSQEFTDRIVLNALKKRKNSPIKSVLLDQSYFPGIGNYLADEILYKTRIHPKSLCQFCIPLHKTLFQTIRDVCSQAILIVANIGGARDDMSDDFPEDWLFNQRWGKQGICPKTKKILNREKIGGRTTVWSADLQVLRTKND
jgi:formamidopyrimidine-DNA glycosylase